MTAVEKSVAVEEMEVLRIVEPQAQQFPEIIILGKTGCGLCESFKQKLDDHLHLPYTFVDWSGQDVTQFDWRNSKAVDFIADCAINDIDTTMFPVIGIDGKGYKYAGAMKELKRLMADDTVDAPVAKKGCSSCKM